MRRFAKISIGALIVAFCGAIGLWGTQAILSEDQQEDGGSRGERATRVTVTQPTSQEIDDSVKAVGSVRPIRSINLRSIAPGRVADVAVQSGAEVSEGDLILQLDARIAKAELAQERATLEEARQRFDRLEQLSAGNVAAESSLEEARGALLRAQAGVQMAEATLEDRSLRAPFPGTLGLIDIDPGEYIDNATVIGPLHDLSRVEADFALPERYFDRVRPGQEVRISTSIHPDMNFRGKVTFRSPQIGSGSRSFRVRAEIDNTDQLLTGGMFINAELIFETYEGLTLADDAIISEGTATYVYVVRNETAHRTRITPGQSGDGRTEIIDGLDGDSRVVVTGWGNLTDGAPVTIAEDMPQEAQQ